MRSDYRGIEDRPIECRCFDCLLIHLATWDVVFLTFLNLFLVIHAEHSEHLVSFHICSIDCSSGTVSIFRSIASASFELNAEVMLASVKNLIEKFASDF